MRRFIDVAQQPVQQGNTKQKARRQLTEETVTVENAVKTGDTSRTVKRWWR